MSIKFSDLGFDVSTKIKSVIFPDDVLIEGDFFTPLIPLFSDPSLGEEIARVLAKINSLKEEAKNQEIESLKAKKRTSKSKDDSDFDRTDPEFWAKVSKDFEIIISQLIKDDQVTEIISQPNYPQFSLDRMWSRYLYSYFALNMIESGAFEGITGTSKKLEGHCKKVDRVKCNKWITSLIDDWQWKVTHHFEMLYILKLSLDKIFESDAWEHTYTPRLNQSFKQEMNLISNDDWDWLHSPDSDCLFETPRTARWSIDKEKLALVFSQLESLLEVNNSDEKIDLKAYTKIVNEIVGSSNPLAIINKATVKRLLEAKGKKQPILTNPVFKLAEISEDQLEAFKAKKEVSEEGDETRKNNKNRLTV